MDAPRGVPARPRLAERVAARRHRSGDAEHVVLHDLETGGRVVVGEREWTLLGVADGTRDLPGMIEAARRRGARVSPEHLETFLGQLAGAGLVVDGPGDAEGTEPGGEHGAADGGASRGADALPTPSASSDVASSDAASSDAGSSRPLVPLPGFGLRCDGSGSCCRLYPSVVFTPPEVVRARALLPELEDVGMDPARLFTPERGVDRGEPRTWVVAQRDGRCSYLDRDGRCALHVAGGAAAKPLGCRTYPARFVDDGQVVRVAPLVECACVLASACEDGAEGGDPLLPTTWATRADLAAGIWVEALAAEIGSLPAAPSRARRGARGRTRPRRASATTFRRRCGRSPPTWMAATPRSTSAPSGAGPLRSAGGPRRAREDRSWRAPGDLALLGVDWMARGSARLAEITLSGETCPEADARTRRAEAFYARALLHGHQLPGQLDVATALRDRAARLLVARAMVALPLAAVGAGGVANADLGSVERWPLALVEALLRSHGLAANARGISEEATR
ncbi:MAG: YkgJ family cysteine cluster protein [Polyangiaceae bacterium]